MSISAYISKVQVTFVSNLVGCLLYMGIDSFKFLRKLGAITTFLQVQFEENVWEVKLRFRSKIEFSKKKLFPKTSPLPKKLKKMTMYAKFIFYLVPDLLFPKQPHL